MPQLEVYLLGAPQVKRSGKNIALKRRKATAVLAYLAVNGQSQSRDILAALLWPEADQAHARMALRKTLSVLKQAIGETWLDLDGEHITLKPQPGLWVDLANFQALCQTSQAHAHPANVACPECMLALTQAVSICRGDLLSGFGVDGSVEFDNWLLFQREKLNRELEAALEKLLIGHTARREFEQALSYGRRWSALNPCNESIHAHLMEIYARAGRREAAVQQYQACRQILKEELGIAPGTQVTNLYETILKQAGEPGAFSLAPAPVLPNNLSLEPVPFFGRKEQLAKLNQLLRDPDCRMVTILGVGGIGKTRLALEAARQEVHAPDTPFADGIFVTSLAHLHAPQYLVTTLAHALNLSLQAGQPPRRQLLEYLCGKQLLLLLDNFEHILAGVDVLVEILSSAPRVKLLITSRERLNVRWEWPFEIDGLDYPPAHLPAEALTYSSIQLFAHVARRAYSKFSLSPEQLPFVVRLCAFLQGIPLAIELAAAWVETFACQEIYAALEQSPQLITTSFQDVPARHHSLTAAFTHSWNLLSPEEKKVFMQLSVFRDGFQREAAGQVAESSLSALSNLMHKSLVQQTPAGRYMLLEVLRQYGAAQLAQAADAWHATHTRHCHYYGEFLARQEPGLNTQEQPARLQAIEAEIGNIRAAWRWASEHQVRPVLDMSLSCLAQFYNLRSWYLEGQETFAGARQALAEADTAQAQPPPHSLLYGKLLARQGWFCQSLTLVPEAREALTASLAICQRHTSAKEVAFCLNTLGTLISRGEGKYTEAVKLYQAALAIYRELADRAGTANCLNNLGLVNRVLGNLEEAKVFLGESLTLRKELKNPWAIASTLVNLALLLTTQKDLEKAGQYLQESLSIFQEINNLRGMAYSLSSLGRIAETQGHYQSAYRFHQQTLSILEKLGDRTDMAQALNGMGCALFHLEGIQAALECFRKALLIARDLKIQYLAIETLADMADILALAGKKEQALELAESILMTEVHATVKDQAEQLAASLRAGHLANKQTPRKTPVKSIEEHIQGYLAA